MVNCAGSEVPFAPGDVVLQASRGITGWVVEITRGPEPKVVVQFGDGSQREMSSGLATTALTKLSPDGLRAQAIKNRDALVACDKENPLKLMALALVDLNGIAKLSSIRREIEDTRLLSTRWETWWKRVRPAMQQSTHFKVRLDGTYELLTSPDEITVGSLPRIARDRVVGPTQSQLVDLTKKVETGVLSLEDVRGAKAKVLVARDLIERSDTSREAKAAALSSLQGPVASARIVLDEYIKKADKQSILCALFALLDHIVDLLSHSSGQEARSAEHLNAKLTLFHDRLVLTISRLGSGLEASDLLSLYSRLLLMATELWGPQTSGWRMEAYQSVLSSLSSIAVVQPPIMNATATELADMQVEPDLCVRVASGVVETMSDGDRDDALRRLIGGALVLPSEYPYSLIRGLLRDERRFGWLAENIGDIVQMAGPAAYSAIGPIIERIGSRIRTGEAAGYVRLVMAVTLGSPVGGVSLSRSVRERISEWASDISLEEADDDMPDYEDVLMPVKIAIEARVKREQDRWDDVVRSMQSEVSDLQARNTECEDKIDRLQGLIQELKSGYHMPEKWVEYRARKDVLERLGMLYQEIHAIRPDEHMTEEMKWILRQIETVLAKNGVSLLGREGTTVRFNPSQYEFIRGTETSEERVVIRCPGFAWRDPADNSVVLVRAQVSRQ